MRAPSIGIAAYLSRLHKYFQCSDSCLVVSLVYIDRVVKLHPNFSVSNLSIHRLLAMSMVLSAKFLDDIYYSNAYYAKVCGLQLKEFNILEAMLLNLLCWQLDVTLEEYTEYQGHVAKAIPVVDADIIMENI